MRVRASGFVAGIGLLLLAGQSASACNRCHRTPCVMPQAPAVQCVTEMVPYTVMQNRTRIDYREETCTVMVREVETTFVDRQRVVCKPVFDTTTVQKTISVCRPVFQTDYVTENVTVCRPETTTRQVTETCMQAYTQLVSVPVAAGRCGRCGHAAPACGCQTVAQTCYRPVPVVRDVVETRMVPEVQSRQVPVTRCSIVREDKVIDVPIVHCRMVQETVTDKVPVCTVHCVPKTITRQIPVPVCEVVPVTCYRPVTRMVPCAAPQYAAATPQMAPSGQTDPVRVQPAPSGSDSRLNKRAP